MKHKFWIIFPVLAMSLSSCRVVEVIFKTGFWSGIILVAGVLFLIGYLVMRSRKS